MTGTILRRLVLSLAALPLLAAVDAVAQDDHLKCFEVKDLVTRNERVTADLAPNQNPPFQDQNCRVRLRAGHYCTAASKDNVLNPDGSPYEGPQIDAGGAGNYFCYLVRCRRESDAPRGGRQVRVRDQFGERNIFVKTADFLCAPVETEPVATPTATFTPDATFTPTPSPTPTPTATATSTETATPTATPTAVPCGPTGENQCGGDCPTDSTCLLVPTKGDPQCECVADDALCRALDVGTGPAFVCGGICPPGTECLLAQNGDAPCACTAPAPCGDLGGGVCGGACADDGDLCLFNDTSGQCACESAESSCRRVDVGTAGGTACLGLCGSDAGFCFDLLGFCTCGFN
jgi:hypothetical protein